ncbi:hypothetical protein RRG08_016777 [Elysia crispata]|uniref:Uncharacterized protein n=1 Tax=Elysia crispata TaxID=231223 RepID=A0AAE0ZZ20_9GAST|nr:hypothetical protein RRG08_016777 [Elysia crispata]
MACLTEAQAPGSRPPQFWTTGCHVMRSRGLSCIDRCITGPDPTDAVGSSGKAIRDFFSIKSLQYELKAGQNLRGTVCDLVVRVFYQANKYTIIPPIVITLISTFCKENGYAVTSE